MYTQCPECSTAFRVTANVLRQAAGKVRCGGCRHAFNALDYLSETMPERSQPPEPEERLPELKPERPQSGGALPESISARQSAALLKTLDQLAGSNIRIEDTGVEWRVLDDDELGESPVDEIDSAPVDELLDDTPTPVDQYLEDAPGEVDSPEIFTAEANGPASTPVEELRFDDNTPLPENFGFEEDRAQPAPRTTIEIETVETIPEEPQADLELADPDEWEDLLGEVDSLISTVGTAASHATRPSADDAEETGDIEIEAIDVDDIEDAIGADSVDELLDMDTQFALQAEAMGIEVSGRRRVNLDLDDQVPEDEPDLEETILDEDLSLEEQDEDPPPRPRSANFELDLDGTGATDVEDPFGDDPDTLIAEFDENVDEEAEDDALDIDDDDDIEIALDDETGNLARPAKPYIPPMTEEEETINMMIDQDLLSVAVEDEDGFISTIVMPDKDASDMVAEEQAKTLARADDAAGFETIIMEGELIRSELDDEKLAADAAEAKALVKEARAREAEAATQGRGRRFGMIAAAILLALLLVAQVLHFSREAFATNTTFNDLAGPMYRAIGKPLVPAWDIGGWRFEVTRGNADVTANTLTIYSRIGNKSDKPLPYPLIGISLTDRFEEVIGSRVLEPADYLTDDLDPRKLVRPGNTFNAVMTIRSPAPEATGFKLNVCYRVTGGKLRCAIQDFR